MLIEGYLHKFDEYNEIISELRSKLDVIDQKINSEKNIIKENELAATNEFSDMVKDRSHKAISHNIMPVTKNLNVTSKDVGRTINFQRDSEKN